MFRVRNFGVWEFVYVVSGMGFGVRNLGLEFLVWEFRFGILSLDLELGIWGLEFWILGYSFCGFVYGI